MICCKGSSSLEICTGLVVPRGGSLTAGSGSTVHFFLVTGIGMRICKGGADGGLEMIA